MKDIKISIIIPTLNRARSLKIAVESVIKQNFPTEQYEILIIDNGSIDNTKDLSDSLIESHRDYVIHYFLEPEPGAVSGRHRGALEAKGNILVFIDDDIKADKNWLKAIDEAFRYPDVHMVGGRNLPYYEIEPPVWLNEMWSPTPSGGRACYYLSLLDLGDEEREMDPTLVWTLNFSIRKKTLFDLGGLHPDALPKHLLRFRGDGEYGITGKASEKGLKTIYQPKALVYHIIPSERLTVEYFELRQFYQGVSDSYTHIRVQKGNIGKEQELQKSDCGVSRSMPEWDSVYEGYLDRADCNMISGWAWNMNQPDAPVYVDIYDDSTLLETVMANEFRQDLLDASKGSGEHAFNYPVPPQLKDGKPHSILVRVSGSNFYLGSMPEQINCEYDPFCEIKYRLWKAYKKGYRFHQTEVMRDPELLKWVLKEDYWDYRLPQSK